LTTTRPSGYFNYDKIFERGTTRLWVILIMGRENYRKVSLWAENCPNFLAGLKKLKFFSGKVFSGKLKTINYREGKNTQLTFFPSW
jgi:hypothetical protein